MLYHIANIICRISVMLYNISNNMLGNTVSCGICKVTPQASVLCSLLMVFSGPSSLLAGLLIVLLGFPCMAGGLPIVSGCVPYVLAGLTCVLGGLPHVLGNLPRIFDILSFFQTALKLCREAFQMF